MLLKLNINFLKCFKINPVKEIKNYIRFSCCIEDLQGLSSDLTGTEWRERLDTWVTSSGRSKPLLTADSNSLEMMSSISDIRFHVRSWHQVAVFLHASLSYFPTVDFKRVRKIHEYWIISAIPALAWHHGNRHKHQSEDELTHGCEELWPFL